MAVPCDSWNERERREARRGKGLRGTHTKMGTFAVRHTRTKIFKSLLKCVKDHLIRCGAVDGGK
jgi:hypothetical protein